MADIEVRVVLGGGGSRGFAHIGVLKALAEHDILIRGLVGTSAGSMVGALFAYNRAVRYVSLTPLHAQREAAQAVEDTCLYNEFKEFYDYAPGEWRHLGSGGILHGDVLESWLESQLWLPRSRRAATFADVDFDLTITATDAMTGQDVVFSRSHDRSVSIHTAVRASASIPFLFTPRVVTSSGRARTCWDGGVVGNCRVDLAQTAQDTLPIVASSLTYAGEPVALSSLSLLASILHMMSLSGRRIEDLITAAIPSQRLLLITPNVTDIDGLNFDLSPKARTTLIQRGYDATAAVVEKLTRPQP